MPTTNGDHEAHDAPFGRSRFGDWRETVGMCPERLDLLERPCQGDMLNLGDAVAEEELASFAKVNPGNRRRRLVAAYRGDGHLLSIAPTRKGKTSGLAIPALLTYSGSVLVIDPRGEIVRATAAYRQKLGHKVLVIDPFRVTSETSSGIDPLANLVPSSPDFHEIADVVARALVVAGPEQREIHFDERAAIRIRESIKLLAALQPGRLTLVDVFEWLCCTPLLLRQQQLESLAESNLADVRRSAATLLSGATEESASVDATVARHLDFLSFPQTAGVFSRTGHCAVATWLGEDKVTLYIVVPPHLAVAQSRLLRLIVAIVLRGLSTRRCSAGLTRPLILLDEFPLLGTFEPAIQAIALAAGFGARLWIFAQNLAQLRSHYPNDFSTFFANTEVQLYFGAADYETARYVSDSLGSATVSVLSTNNSDGIQRPGVLQNLRGHFGSSSASQAGTTLSQHGRPLLFPDEIMRLPSDLILARVQGCNPLLLKRFRYDDPRFPRC